MLSPHILQQDSDSETCCVIGLACTIAQHLTLRQVVHAQLPVALSCVGRSEQGFIQRFNGLKYFSIKTNAFLNVFTARAYVRAVLGVVILSVRQSVRPSDTRVDCNKTK